MWLVEKREEGKVEGVVVEVGMVEEVVVGRAVGVEGREVAGVVVMVGAVVVMVEEAEVG
jgi:hypothetical protein